MSDSHTLDRLLDPGIRPRRPAADPNTPRPTVLPDFTADTTAEATRDSEGPANSIPDEDYTAFAHGRISRHPKMMLALHVSAHRHRS